MKLATAATYPVKGDFDSKDPVFGSKLGILRLDLAQGDFGRAFCYINQSGQEPTTMIFDLPDPKQQALNIEHGGGKVEINAKHGLPAYFNRIKTGMLNVTGDVNVTTLQVRKLECTHSVVQVQELTGEIPADTQKEIPADPVSEITLNDSNVISKSELYFQNLTAEEHESPKRGSYPVSKVQAPYIEGVVTSGPLILQADKLMVINLDAAEVRVTNPQDCVVGRTWCHKFYQQNNVGALTKISPMIDPHLAEASQHVSVDEGHQLPELNGPSKIVDNGISIN